MYFYKGSRLIREREGEKKERERESKTRRSLCLTNVFCLVDKE